MSTSPTAITGSRNHIAAEWLPGHGDEVIQVISPVTDRLVGLIPAGTQRDAAAAVAAARAALPAWQTLPTASREEMISAAVQRLTADIQRLAELQNLEMGQPIKLAQDAMTGSLTEMLTCVKRAADIRNTSLSGGRIVRQGRGVAALIVPWNFPIPVALDGLGPLLATGNTVVWKPSERSPLSAIHAMQALAACLPPGVVNLLLGDRRAGEPLINEDIDLVVFTGSEATGRRIGELTGKRLIKVVLELGGKDPVIIDEDVDPEWAAAQVADGAFRNAGQLCTSMERIYVHEAIAAQFVTALTKAAKQVTLGPLVDSRHRAIVDSQVRDAINRGARAVVGGTSPETGSYYPATVLVDVPDDAIIMHEETFGPVAPVRIVASFEEGLRLADSTTFGLGATVFTRNMHHMQSAVSTLQAGIIWLNEWWCMAEGWSGEPKRSSGLGAGWGPGLMLEITTSTYIHDGALPPAATSQESFMTAGNEG